MLVNVEVMRQWPLPIKHGAPLLPAMIALHQGRRLQPAAGRGLGAR
jgi:hypothetical protein